jgi:hypothetical protein
MFIGHIFQRFEIKDAKTLALKAVAVIVVILLFTFTVNVAFQESYQKGDEPPQMLMYAGVSSDVPPIMKRVVEIAQETGEGYDLSITVDARLFYNGPAWYFREYNNIDFDAAHPKGTVLIIHEDTVREMDQSYLEKYDEGQRFRHIIWFPEEYRDFSLGWWWGYFFNRDTEGTYRDGGAQDGYLYILRSPP